MLLTSFLSLITFPYSFREVRSTSKVYLSQILKIIMVASQGFYDNDEIKHDVSRDVLLRPFKYTENTIKLSDHYLIETLDYNRLYLKGVNSISAMGRDQKDVSMKSLLFILGIP